VEIPFPLEMRGLKNHQILKIMEMEKNSASINAHFTK
jgi:hypothetical protein